MLGEGFFIILRRNTGSVVSNEELMGCFMGDLAFDILLWQEDGCADFAEFRERAFSARAARRRELAGYLIRLGAARSLSSPAGWEGRVRARVIGLFSCPCVLPSVGTKR